MKMAQGEYIVSEEKFGNGACTLTNKRLVVGVKSDEDSYPLDHIRAVKTTYGKGFTRVILGAIFILAV